ncbi:hypothetical protein SLEP1_g18613 [Rubroshorea leprosula]|uniref:Uncharacterized protein n=1 Tax=Rubroshorea leprosula TaxID=152421 RepID=A0AAV5J3N1_9ROSI|nr:hypothetical protein SLEP1_g18613 [Rubroshorea leprosula]
MIGVEKGFGSAIHCSDCWKFARIFLWFVSFGTVTKTQILKSKLKLEAMVLDFAERKERNFTRGFSDIFQSTTAPFNIN